MGVTILIFVVELQEESTKCIFSDFWEKTGQVSKWRVCERGKKVLKNLFIQNLHCDITVRTQCDKRWYLNENQSELAAAKF